MCLVRAHDSLPHLNIGTAHSTVSNSLQFQIQTNGMPPGNTLARSQYSFILAFYYRATLCVNAVFAVARCLSVCLSVTFVHFIHTAADIVKLLCRPGSPSFYFFDPQRQYPIPREPFQRGCKIQGVLENFAIFYWNRRLSRKRYEIGLQWNINWKSYALYRMVTFSMTSTDP